MAGDNGWFEQNCDPSPDGPVSEPVVSGGGPVNKTISGQPVSKTVNSVIENLIGQCYPSQAPQSIRNFVPQQAPDANKVTPVDVDLGFMFEWMQSVGIEPPQAPSIIRFTNPDPSDPTSGDLCLNSPDGTPVDCSRKYPFEQCIKDHIDCIFRPYAAGTWKPPQADCDTYVPERQFGYSNRICVENCVPERVAIYEHVKSDGSDHSYTLDSATPSGYQDTRLVFYGLKQQEVKGAEPIYVSYSSSTTDTMLTADPKAEKATMDAAGMGSRNTVMFYAFRDSSAAVAALTDGEQAYPVYRYYNPNTQDHRYTLTPIGGPPLEPVLNKGYYKLGEKVSSDLKIKFNSRKGSAAYENAFGYYFTDANNNPVFGRVIIKNATDASGKQSYTIPASEVNQYAPCRLGFFMVPDGNRSNSLTKGQAVSFSDTGNGWRSNLNSAQSNYTFFSEKRLNVNKKQFTSWTSRWWQWWEDLINGDDDYDDVKISYRLNYAGSNWYYEGIACYVFTELKAPVYRDLTAKDGCDKSLMLNTFKDVFITRHGCGGVDQWDDSGAAGCATCSGEYGRKQNVAQNITISTSGTLSLRSHGGMTGGFGGCTEFSYRLLKNGSAIFTDTVTVSDWREIGYPLHTFSVQEGDDLTFQVLSVTKGHYSGHATPSFSLWNEDSKKIYMDWTVNISTHSETLSEIESGVPVAAVERCGLPQQISLYDMDNISNSTIGWTLSGGVTNNNLTTNTRPTYIDGTKKVTDDSYGIMVREVGGESGLTISVQYQAISNGRMRYTLLGVLDRGDGGFRSGQLDRIFLGKNKTNGRKWHLGVRIDSINGAECPSNGAVQGMSFGVTREDAEQGNFGLPAPALLLATQSITGAYYDSAVNELVEVLFTDKLKDTSSAVSDLYNQPVTFVQYLGRKLGAGEPVYFYHDVILPDGGTAFKVRLRGSVFIKDAYDLIDSVNESKAGYNIRWTVDSVISFGTGYADGQTFVYTWPDPNVVDNEGNNVESPYYPDNRILPKKIKITNFHQGILTRSGKWAIYQSSHDKSSTIWYSNASRGKTQQFRDYRIIIEDAQ